MDILNFKEDLLNKLNTEGIIKVEKFLNEEQTLKAYKIIKRYSVEKGHKDSYLSKSKMDLFRKILKLRFDKFFDHLTIYNLVDQTNQRQFAEIYFKSKVKLFMVDNYYNKASDQKILPWHTDQSKDRSYHPDYYSLKFFVYLTNVDKNNGCMSYVPKSHLICNVIRKGIYGKQIENIQFRTLNEFKSLLANKSNYEFIKERLDNPKILDQFIENTSKLKDSEISEFDYAAKPGDAILFHEGGIHRGSKPSINDRLVIRFHWRKDIKH